MTQEQLELLIDGLKIDKPERCPKSRQALAKLVLRTFTKWDRVLNSDKITVKTLRKIFKDKCGNSSDLAEVKSAIMKRIKLIVPGEESLYM